jgi:hypothetical protein
MNRMVFFAAPLLFLVALPAEAEAAQGQNCNYEAQARRQAARNVLGGLAGGMLGRVGGAAVETTFASASMIPRCSSVSL